MTTTRDWFLEKVSANEIILMNCDYNRYEIDKAYLLYHRFLRQCSRHHIENPSLVVRSQNPYLDQ